MERKNEYIRKRANYLGQVMIVWTLQVTLCIFILFELKQD